MVSLSQSDEAVANGRHRPCDDIVVVLSDESLLGGIADLRWRLDDILADGAANLVIDVSRVAVLSSATVAVLLWATRQCQARGLRAVVRNPSAQTMALVRRTGLDDVLRLERSGATATDRQAPPRGGSPSVGGEGTEGGEDPLRHVRTTVVNFLGTSHAPMSARKFIAEWCHIRAVPVPAAHDLAQVVSGAIGTALEARPRSLSLGLGWRGPDHVAVEIVWKDLRSRVLGPETDVTEATALIFDAIAADWGFDQRRLMCRAWFVLPV